MECTTCQFISPFNLKFCGRCGSRVKQICADCGFDNPLDFKFCGNCGTNANQNTAILTPKAPSLPKQVNIKFETEAERRHLTVMFCDLVGSTALSDQLDPEDLRHIVTEYQKVCQKVVARFEGHIAQYLGDGILVYFGFPVTRGNDAHRAVSSGLGIIEAMEQLNIKLEAEIGTRIAVRIGVHTGHTVIGDILSSSGQNQRLAHGATLNIAARLEGLATSNAMVISEVTYQLVHRYFVCEDKGEHSVKGIEKPMKIYRVIRENTARARLEDLQNFSEQMPLVGRENELNKLLELWDAAKESRSHIVLLNGEAGVGKSRLLQEFIQEVANDTNAWLMVHQCSAYHKKTAFYTFGHSLKHLALKLDGNEPPEEQIGRLEGFLVQNGLSLEEMIPLFAGILNIDLSDSSYDASPYSPRQQQEKIVNAFISIYLDRAKKQPLLLTFEDLHWIDDASLQVLNMLVRQAPSSRLLTILSFRPEFKVSWRMQRHLIPISLAKLSDKAVRAIIYKISDGKRLPESLTNKIVQKTDGVPLFVEELTKMVLNSDMVNEFDTHYELAQPIESLAIPSTLQDSLIARLDGMERAKTVAQIGAAIGREFIFDLIMATSEMEEAALRFSLEELVKTELLLQQGVLPKATFKFRQALIQDAAYQSLLNSQSKKIHLKIAESLTHHFPDRVENNPQTAAFHFEKAGEYTQAIVHWTKAGDKLRRRQAFTEALDYLQRGLELIPNLKKTREQMHLELGLLSIQAPVLLMTKGYASKSAYRASKRLKELAESLGDNVSLFHALRNESYYYLFAESTQSALQSAQRALEVAQREADEDLLLEAYRIIGQTSIYAGEYQQSVDSFNRAIDLYQAKDGKMRHTFIGGNPFIFSLAQSSHALWYLGYHDQAINRINLAIEKAEEMGDIFNKAISLFIHCFLSALTRDIKKCEEYANGSIEICEKYGIKQFLGETEIYIAYLHVKNGQFEIGKQMVDTALKKRLELNIHNGFHVHAQVIVEAYLEKGELEGGLTLVEQSLGIAEKTGDQLCLSETYRLKGELLFAKDRVVYLDEIEQCYQTSWQIAQVQGAKSFQLRTAMSLLRLGEYKGEIKAARQRLFETYEWFTEGFDTLDLIEAKSLLNHIT